MPDSGLIAGLREGFFPTIIHSELFISIGDIQWNITKPNRLTRL